MAGEPIPGLAGSVLHETAAELHRRHDGAGICAGCGQRCPCPVRRRAAVVLAACGEFPAWSLSGMQGWAVTGRVHPGQAAGYVYDRP